MYNTTKKQVWIGELRTARGNTIVIFDKAIPDASPGRVYLFNTQRNAIVEYVEDIVKPNLHELDADAAKQAEAEHGSAWQIVKAEFLGKRPKLDEAAPVLAKKKSKAEVETETEDNFEDDFDSDDDWSNDDFDDD